MSRELSNVTFVFKTIQNILRMFISLSGSDDVTLHINTQRDTNTYIIAYDLWSGNTTVCSTQGFAVVLYTSVHMLFVSEMCGFFKSV